MARRAVAIAAVVCAAVWAPAGGRGEDLEAERARVLEEIRVLNARGKVDPEAMLSLIGRLTAIEARRSGASAPAPSGVDATAPGARRATRSQDRPAQGTEPRAAIGPVASRWQEFHTLVKGGNVAAADLLISGLIEEAPDEALALGLYYHGAVWLTLALQDHRRSLALAQAGLDRIAARGARGETDLATPGDCGLFFARCMLWRARSQALARMGKVAEARAAADEVVGALVGSLERPGPGGDPWAYAGNLGHLTLFGQVVFPVMEAAAAARGEAGAAEHVEWALGAIGTGRRALDAHAARGGIGATFAGNYARVLDNARAEVLLDAGRAAEALAILERIPMEVGPDPSGKAYMAFFLMNRARARARAGQEAAALEDLANARRVLDAADRQGNIMGHRAWMPRWRAGQIHEAAGRSREAIVAYAGAVQALRSLYRSVGSTFARIELLRESDRVYARLVRLLLSAGRVGEAVDVIEESQAKELVDTMGDPVARGMRTWPAEVREKVLARRRELHDLEAQPVAAQEEEASASRQRRLALRAEVTRLVEVAQAQAEGRADPRWDAARAALAGAPPGEAFAPGPVGEPPREGHGAGPRGEPPREGHGAGPGGRAAAGPVLKANDRFRTVVLLVREDPCTAVVMGSHAVQVVALPTTASEVRRLARRLRKAVTARRGEWREPARELHRCLVAPLAPAIGRSTRLLFVPEGDLWYVPMGALLGPSDAPLVATYRYALASSLAAAARRLREDARAAAAAPRGRLLVLADPDGTLPSARAEAEALSRVGKGRWTHTVLAGDRAGERALEDAVADRQPGTLLHVAAHGVLDAANPLFSHLVLAPGGGEDGRLTVLEVGAEMDLTGVDLAVLSGCNTAAGELAGGNEVLGLSQAFDLAGVRGVVASLWEVSDVATAALMRSLYERLAAGAAPADALAIAMNDAARPGPQGPADPWLWAAFQLYGVP